MCTIYTLVHSQYRARDKPWYKLGHGIVLAYISIGWLTSLLYLIILKHENALRDAGKRDEVIRASGDGAEIDIENDEEMKKGNERNGVFESVEEARREKGDEWSGFRYTL